MAKQSRAWLLNPLGLPPCAVAEHEIMQFFNSAPAYPVPFALRHCESAIRWQDHLVPLMNLSPLSGEQIPARDLAVLAYQEAQGEPLRYIALALKNSPLRITVDDASACELPTEHKDLWTLLANACFRYEQTATPIIDIKRLCSTQFRDYAAQRLASMPDLVATPIVAATPMATLPMSASIPQAMLKPVLDVSAINARDGLIENINEEDADLLDELIFNESDFDMLDDDFDALDEMDEENAELSMDDDLDDIDLDEVASDDELDVEDFTDTDDLEDDLESDDDESLDNITRLEDDSDEIFDDEFETEEFAAADDLEDDIVSDDDELGDDELGDDENSLDDIAWLEDDSDEIFDDELETEEFAAADDLEDDINLDGDEFDDDEDSLDDMAWLAEDGDETSATSNPPTFA